MSLQARFAETMARLVPAPRSPWLGVAVSGGGDSTALLFLAADWAAREGVGLHVVTIDHGLRPESSAEATEVAARTAGLGLPHTTLRWGGWQGQGNLQEAARRARQRLLAGWRGEIDTILLGHTMDDQAETFVLNLARGSGVAGLAGMGERRVLRGIEPLAPAGASGPMPASAGPGGKPMCLLRPLLTERREVLREWLRGRGIGWLDDPANEDARFDRVRIRRALDTAPMGLDVEGLAATAARMRRALAALEARAAEAGRRIARVRHGDVVFRRDGLAALEEETRATLLAHALQWVSTSVYRPRAAALAEVTADILTGGARTLHGCLLIAREGEIRVTREEKAVSDLVVPFDGATTWDRRWLIRGPEREGTEVRVLGQRGLSRLGPIPGDRTPRAALTGLPALYRGDEVIALPGLLPGPWIAELRPPRGGFIDSLATA